VTVRIAIPVFDGLTALDAVGPYEVLSRLPGASVVFAGVAGPGPIRTENGMLGIVADAGLSELGEVEVLVLPGGFGTPALMHDEAVLSWVRSVHERSQWTTSVCTGSLVLAAAGLLDGLEATTHWASMDLLGSLGAVPVSRRVVRQGKIMTAAGVSSGIDMALGLAALIAGEETARAIQLGIEYDPQPPFDSGSVAKADPALVQRARGVS
jgi:putative intracellular protease/amidase